MLPSRPPSFEEIKAYEHEVHQECLAEVRRDDPVIRNVRYKCFVSRTKGRKRKRRCWKEIELINLSSRPGCWHQPHRLPLDELTTELAGGLKSADELLWHIRDNCADT